MNLINAHGDPLALCKQATPLDKLIDSAMRAEDDAKYAPPPTVAQRMTLPTDSAERKEVPLCSGVLAYFPAALAGVARISKQGNDKHNPGEPLHHARGKSMDHADCIVRHLVDLHDLLAARERLAITAEGQRAILTEVSCLAWRALALSQELHERMGVGVPLAPGAKLPAQPREV